MLMNANTITMTMSTARIAPAMITTIITTMSTTKRVPVMNMSITMSMNTTIMTMGIMVMKTERRAESG